MSKKPLKQPTRVIALAASKGGVGKSTLTAALAVRAAADFDRVALFDADPQLSLSSWWDRRGGPSNPMLFDGDTSAEAIGLVAAEGYQWLFVDTPPSQLDRIEAIIAAADVVLIPTRVGIMDIEAIKVTEELCVEHRRPYAFVLNMVTANATRVTADTVAHLRTGRRVLLEPFVSNRQSYSTAMFAGKTAGEARDAAARAEIDGLWRAVHDFATSKAKKGATA